MRGIYDTHPLLWNNLIVMKLVLVLVLTALGLAAPVAVGQAQPAQAPTQQPSDRVAEAYAQFLMAHRYEDDDKADEAIAAYRRAMALDPTAAEIVSDLANLYMRINRPADAISVGEQALKVDPNNREAHRILGTVHASMATAVPRAGRPTPAAQAESLAKGIEHLEAALRGVARPDANLRAMLAQLYIVNKSHDKAIPILAELVKQEPEWEQGVNFLIDAYEGAGKSDEAMRWLQEAAAENPALYVKLGDLYGESERWREAAASYERAFESMPRDFMVRIRYASALMSGGDPADLTKARTALQEALGIRNNNEQALALLSQAERRAGALAEAEQTARRLITANARNVRGYIVLAEALEERQRYDAVVEALAPVLPAFRSAQNSAVSLSMLLPHLGFAYERLGQADRAVATFEEARKLDPSNPVLTGYLIQAQIAAKRYPDALQLARTARAQHADDVRLASLEAKALHQSGKTDEGIAVLEAFVKRRGDDPRAHIALAQALTEAARGAQAVRVLQTAQARFPAETVLTFELGAAFDKQKRHAEAEAAFRQLIAKEPEHAGALNYLGYILAERGEKLDESVDLVKRALKIEPENGSYLDSLGWAYYKAGKNDLALEYLQRAADQLTRNSVVQDHYGDVLLRLSRFEDAIAAWTRALEGDGDDINRGDIDRKIRSARQRITKR
jgi:predicted Zn-dependent protease